MSTSSLTSLSGPSGDAPDAHSPMLRVRGVSKTFKSLTALNEVNLEFRPGTMHGIIGPEGAGKTTLMRIMLGLLKPTGGEVQYYQGSQQVTYEKIRPSIAYMPQSQSLYADLSIGEHLDFFRDLYEVPPDAYQQKRKELLHITRLSEFTDRPAGKLSGGMYKKLGLICALLRSPKVILLDEPTNGVDPISRRDFWDLLYRLLDQNILILLTTAYMDEAEKCGCVHLLEKGLVIGEGEPKALMKAEGVGNFNDLFLKRGKDE